MTQIWVNFSYGCTLGNFGKAIFFDFFSNGQTYQLLWFCDLFNSVYCSFSFIKIILDSGEEEVLITNLTDKRFGKNAFKKLYFMRWSIETKYDIVKNKLELENFNTRTIESIEQDFYATMLLANFASSCAIDVQEEINKECNNKGNKYQQKANMNELFGILKDRLVLALIQDTPAVQAEMIESILDEIRRHTTQVKPNRSTPRNISSQTRKFHHYRKPNC